MAIDTVAKIKPLVRRALASIHAEDQAAAEAAERDRLAAEAADRDRLAADAAERAAAQQAAAVATKQSARARQSLVVTEWPTLWPGDAPPPPSLALVWARPARWGSRAYVPGDAVPLAEILRAANPTRTLGRLIADRRVLFACQPHERPDPNG